ncbi:hypothetical protein CesoFtcFv8_027325 [Champsocephalus esox]|uniref:Uncharacterized protein n=1 Tax=Champsocephalus esox TaxID=159716 RepID=A0AAN8AVY2_9TELE|nr:hypothetical protein CesoFtcFv8_027325 [Champsocephalus esox]
MWSEEVNTCPSHGLLAPYEGSSVRSSMWSEEVNTCPSHGLLAPSEGSSVRSSMWSEEVNTCRRSAAICRADNPVRRLLSQKRGDETLQGRVPRGDM